MFLFLHLDVAFLYTVTEPPASMLSQGPVTVRLYAGNGPLCLPLSCICAAGQCVTRAHGSRRSSTHTSAVGIASRSHWPRFVCTVQTAGNMTTARPWAAKCLL